MTIKEFWKLCSQKNGLEIYDDAITLLNGNEISKHVLEEEYDIVNILFDIESALVKLKDYDKLIDLINLLEEKQQPLYEKSMRYFRGTLIEYYCFKKNKEALSTLVDEYINDPLEDIDLLFRATRFLIFYGHSDLVEKLNRSIYRTVKDSPEVLGGGMEIARAVLHIELQKYYEKYLETKELNLTPLVEGLKKIDFFVEHGKEFRSILEVSLTYDYTSNLKELKTTFEQDRNDFLHHLGFYFKRYMYDRGIPFLISSEVWIMVLDYLMEHNDRQKKNPIRFFAINHRTFEKYLANQGGFIMDYSVNVFAGLWGSCFVYDFLFSVELINKLKYQHFKRFYKEHTRTFLRNDNQNLWRYTFVYNWGKPDSLLEEVWEKQKQQFKDTFSVKGEIASSPILNPKWFEDDDDNIIETEDVDYVEVEDSFTPPPKIKPLPPPPPKPKLVFQKKISRNAKVKVRYLDGTVKEAKFKRVQKDLENGDCELV